MWTVDSEVLDGKPHEEEQEEDDRPGHARRKRRDGRHAEGDPDQLETANLSPRGEVVAENPSQEPRHDHKSQ